MQRHFQIKWKVTGLNISRYTDKGGSYRSIQRFFAEEISWKKLKLKLFKKFLYTKEDTYVLSADECVEKKSGKSTFGIDRFFSSIFGKVVLVISFLHLSFLSMKNNDSYSVDVEQIKREKKEKKTATKKKKNKKCGRPSGSKNKNKSIIKSTYLLELVDKMISNLKNTHDAFFKELRIQHFVADGAYVNNNWVLMLEKYDLKLVSKLHHNSALYLPYTGKYFGRGRPKKYGKKIDVNNISFSYLVKTTDDKKNSYIQYIYQIKVLSKNFRDKLNVVIIVRIDRKTGRQANVILFSNDLELSAQKIIDIYSLGFQIEFNFRDAKLFFGLADFKNIKEKQVLNAINLSLFMTLISKILLQKYRIFFDNKKSGVLSLLQFFNNTLVSNRFSE